MFYRSEPVIASFRSCRRCRNKLPSIPVSDFSIDQVNVFKELGYDKFVELSTCFYTKVYADREPSFRGMFPKDMDSAIQNQYEFFIQRMGGPPLYSERKGHPALRARHAHFRITHAHAEKWLAYMREAMVEVAIPEDTRKRMDEFFTDVAFFLQNVDEDGSRLY